ncbi:hypothetical protein FocnCong_v015196 [Fusarium oxysporum f. sp. conglutinans]|nr:hypothetical protein FocnCong_v015196 [Fusarium oxysporum f. sp. conglutinans]
MRNFGRTLTTTPDASSSASTFSVCNQQVAASEWTEQWFFMNGRVHSYDLTWEVEQRDGLESDTGAITQYTIPVLIVKHALPVRLLLPVPPSTPTSASLEPSTPPAKRTIPDYGQTPTKKRHPSLASSSTIPSSQSHESIRSLAVSASSQDELDVSEADVTTTCRPDPPKSDSITAFTSDSPRPHRNRHPSKIYQEVE